MAILLAGLFLATISLVWSLLRIDQAARNYTVKGIDISHHQGLVNWDLLAGDSVDFVFIKATEGVEHLDSRFEENWSQAANRGLVWGPYHFFTFCSPGLPQAKHFLSRLPAEAPMLPPVVDVEFGGNCRRPPSASEIRVELGAFLKEVERVRSRRPILYVNAEAYGRIVGEHFPDYQLWVRSVFQPPQGVWGSGREWLFWQYSAIGEKKGIDGPVDLDAFRGSQEELLGLFW